MNALSVAMFMSTPEIVEMLLDQGFDPMLADSAGNHPFLFACTSNRIDNVKYWLKRFPEWDLELQTQFNGGVALGAAVYLGPNRLELVKLLLKKGALTNSRSWNGTTHLIAQCANEDADPEVLRLLLTQSEIDVNAQIRAQTVTWKCLYVFAQSFLCFHFVLFRVSSYFIYSNSKHLCTFHSLKQIQFCKGIVKR